MKSIGESVFRACAALTEVSFPATVEEILARAFYGCGALQTVTIPENVTKMGTYCFHYTKFYNDRNVDDNGQGGFHL